MELKHYFRITVADVGDEEFDIESILCDTFPSMKKSWSGPKGMETTKSSDKRPTSCQKSLAGIFLASVDLEKTSIEEMYTDVTTSVWKAAGRFVPVCVQGFLIENNSPASFGTPEMYSKMKSRWQLDVELEDEWEDDDE